MGWITHRNNLIAISLISAFFLFGLGKSLVGVGLMDNLFGTGLTMANLLGVGAIYLFVALWKRYI